MCMLKDDSLYLRSLEEVVLLWVVLEEDDIVVTSWPVCQAIQDLLVVLQGPLYESVRGVDVCGCERCGCVWV